MEALVPVFYLVVCVLIGAWNTNRGNPFWVGFIASLFLTPLIGAIFVAVTKKTEKTPV